MLDWRGDRRSRGRVQHRLCCRVAEKSGPQHLSVRRPELVGKRHHRVDVTATGLIALEMVQLLRWRNWRESRHGPICGNHRLARWHRQDYRPSRLEYRRTELVFDRDAAWYRGLWVDEIHQQMRVRVQNPRRSPARYGFLRRIAEQQRPQIRDRLKQPGQEYGARWRDIKLVLEQQRARLNRSRRQITVEVVEVCRNCYLRIDRTCGSQQPANCEHPNVFHARPLSWVSENIENAAACTGFFASERAFLHLGICNRN